MRGASNSRKPVGMKTTARLGSLLIVLVVLAGLTAQFIVTNGTTGGQAATTIWIILGYFTILTNVLVLATHAMQLLQGRFANPQWLGGLTLWIVIVGVIYHLLLAGLWQPEGLLWWADFLLHTVSPVLSVLWWLILAPRVKLPWITAAQWLVWPIAYTVYALTRGLLTNHYPYPFMDMNVLTPAQMALNAVVLMTGFFLGGLVMVLLTRLRG